MGNLLFCKPACTAQNTIICPMYALLVIKGDNMKFRLFGKRDDDEKQKEQEETDLAPTEDASIEARVVEGFLDIEKYEHKTFGGGTIDSGMFLNAMIPAVGTAVDAAAQYGQAIVRFPKGANWSDLLNRKTPGWEGFKQLGILKDGKFQPQAAIKQAKLQPAAIGNLALQGAAMVVGQAYMVEINKQLDEITEGISSIQEEMRIERESNVEASMEMLKEYAFEYLDISNDPERAQAVRNQIESIRKDAKEAWIFQIKLLGEMNKKLNKHGNMKGPELRGKLREFSQRDKAAHDAFIFLMASEQVKMQYNQDYSESQINKEKDEIQQRLNEYNTLRDNVQSQLQFRISKFKGSLFVVPPVEKRVDKSSNPALRLAHAVGDNAPRIFPPTMHQEAKKKTAAQKRQYDEFVSKENPLLAPADARKDSLDTLSFIYNEANTVILDDHGIHYLKNNENKN